MRRLLYLFIAFSALLSACKEGSLIAPAPPDTQIFVDSVALGNPENPQRLPSRLRMRWSGSSAGSYVTGYKVAYLLKDTNNVQALFRGINTITTRSDSTFIFVLPAGVAEPIVYFYVQAIDAKGNADPTPARLALPVVNRKPEAAFLSTGSPLSNYIYSVLTLPVSASDPDGNETLDSLEVKINDGNWLALPATTNLITFVPANPQISGTTNARIYLGNTAALYRRVIAGLKIGDSLPGIPFMNRIYLRSKDITGTYSDIAATVPYFVYRQKSDLLVVDADTLNSNRADADYANILRDAYPSGYDYMSLMQTVNGNAGANQPYYWNITFALQLSLYKKVFWYSDNTKTNNNSDRNNSLLLETATTAIRGYLSSGGKILISTSLPTGATGAALRLDSNSLAYTILPIANNTSYPGGRLLAAARYKVFSDDSTNYPELSAPSFLTTLTPFFPSQDINTRPLHRTTVTPTRTDAAPWNSGLHFGAKRLGSDGKTNLVFYSIELFKLNGNPNNLKSTFNYILNQELR